MTKISRKLLVGALSAVTFFAVAGAGAYTTDEECEFIEALATDWRMADYATKALDELQTKAPAADKAKLVAARITVLSAQGKLSNAVALVQTLPKGPDADEALLALLKAYFKAGMIKEAKEVAADLFKRYPEPPREAARLKWYRGVCSQIGAMMKAAGDELAAADAGRRYLKTNPEEEIADAIRCDIAVLLIEGAKKFPDKKDALLKEVEQITDIVLKHGVNLFWGQALVAQANALVLKGDRVAAQKLIKAQSDLLTPIDEWLREHNRIAESPRAGILMMNAQMAETDAAAAKDKKDKQDKYIAAFKAYWNVFITYGDSDYGMPAGAKANDIRKILESEPYNRTIKTPLTREQEDRIIGYQFRIADQKMLSKDYAGAIPDYLKVLNDYPESDRSVRAIGSLLRCYAESADKLMVRTTAAYIGERFHNRAFAAPLIATLVSFYFNKKDEQMFYFIGNTYADSFPNDVNASQVLYFMASQKLVMNDYAGAEPYLMKIVSNPQYKNDKAYGDAIRQIGSIQMASSNYTGAAESFKASADSLPESIEKYSAMSRFADALRLSGKYAEAVPVYEQVVASITEKGLDKATIKDVADRARDTLERASFYIGVSYSRLTENVEANRAKATSAYDAFLKKFPGSTNFAPKAMAGRGQVFLLMDNFDEAAKVFNKLATDYPNTPEGKNALVSLVQSALEIKRLDQAKKAFAEMMKGGANVTPAQLVQMGQVWLDNGIYVEAAQTYKGVIGKTQDRNLEQPALFGYGKAQFFNKEYEASAESLKSLVTKYERTPFYFEAKLLLSASLRETGKFKEALDSLSDILLQPSAAPEQKLQAQYEIMMLQLKEGKKKEGLASALRNIGLAVLGGESNPAKLFWLEKIAMGGIAAGQELQAYDDVIELADGYLQLMPQGKEIEAARRARADAVSKGGQVK